MLCMAPSFGQSDSLFFWQLILSNTSFLFSHTKHGIVLYLQIIPYLPNLEEYNFFVSLTLYKQPFRCKLNFGNN